jgi:uncharacterized protein (DUF1697 family)
MPTYVALLRGINIGAKKRIRMEPLRDLIGGLGFTGARTYVNSGNVVFSSPGEIADVSIASTIEAALLREHDLKVPVVVRSATEMAEIAANNPFSEHATDYKTLHVSFLSDLPSAELVNALAQVERGDDDFHVVGKDIYLHYPNGLAGAVFMINGFDRALNVTSTGRNWRTVLKLAEMSSESPLE